MAEDVAQRKLAWTALADAGAKSFSCLYQRSDLTTTVAMSMFLQFLGHAIEQTESQFHTTSPSGRKRTQRIS